MSWEAWLGVAFGAWVIGSILLGLAFGYLLFRRGR